MNFARLLLAYPLYWVSRALFLVADGFEYGGWRVFAAATSLVPRKTCAYHATEGNDG
jgi:hypothetical protein